MPILLTGLCFLFFYPWLLPPGPLLISSRYRLSVLSLPLFGLANQVAQPSTSSFAAYMPQETRQAL